MSSTTQRWYATGKRKTAVARVYMALGKGEVMVNGRKLNDYFGRETSKMILMEPLALVKMQERFDIVVNARGGGLSGQAGAIRHGIAKALQIYDPELRKMLKPLGMLTRDARVKERKKYGQRGARARFQFSKR